MAGLTVGQFVEEVEQICSDSPNAVRVERLAISKCQVKLRIYLRDRTWLSVYYNEDNGKAGFTQIESNIRVFGADNSTGEWHWHPRKDPLQHVPSDYEITFEEFFREIEKTLK